MDIFGQAGFVQFGRQFAVEQFGEEQRVVGHQAQHAMFGGVHQAQRDEVDAAVRQRLNDMGQRARAARQKHGKLGFGCQVTIGVAHCGSSEVRPRIGAGRSNGVAAANRDWSRRAAGRKIELRTNGFDSPNCRAPGNSQ